MNHKIAVAKRGVQLPPHAPPQPSTLRSQHTSVLSFFDFFLDFLSSAGSASSSAARFLPFFSCTQERAVRRMIVKANVDGAVRYEPKLHVDRSNRTTRWPSVRKRLARKHKPQQRKPLPLTTLIPPCTDHHATHLFALLGRSLVCGISQRVQHALHNVNVLARGIASLIELESLLHLVVHHLAELVRRRLCQYAQIRVRLCLLSYVPLFRISHSHRHPQHVAFSLERIYTECH